MKGRRSENRGMRRWLRGPTPRITRGAPASAALVGVGITFAPAGAAAPAGAPPEADASLAKRGPGERVRVAPRPLEGRALYVPGFSTAARQADEWARSRPADAQAMRVLASQPTAHWFGDWNEDVAGDVRRVVDGAAQAGGVAVLVAYNIPQRDCNQYSAGGSGSPDDYRRWIAELARGIGDRDALVVLEPDALPLMDCLSPEGTRTRLSLLREAVKTLKALPGTFVYLDAGHARWVAPEEMARRLALAGVQEADGFALNVSNFIGDDENVAYGERVSRLSNGRHFVIDSSRNGRGPDPEGEWCNPQGRAIGRFPTTDTDNPLVDAFLWIKRPGESDGSCNGGPDAGAWWPDYALGLVRRATRV